MLRPWNDTAWAKNAPSKKKSQSFYKLLTFLLLVGGGFSIYNFSFSLILEDNTAHTTTTTTTTVPWTTVWTVLWSNLMAMQRDTDWGNFLAALVAVGGYLLDAWNNRQYRQLEAQMERVSLQSRNLLVPVTMQCHSFRFATLQFVDRHMTMECIQKYLDDKNNNENKNDDHNASQRSTPLEETPKSMIQTTNTTKHSGSVNAVTLCEKVLEEHMESAPSGLTERPLHLRNPSSNAFIVCDCFLQTTATELPSQQQHDDDTDFSFFCRPADRSSTKGSSSPTMPESSSTSSSRTSMAAPITSLQPPHKLRVPRGYATTVPHELPRPLHHALLHCDKPHSALWKSYEAFIRHEYLPAVDRIASIIDEHGNLMEPVPPARLREMFQTSGTGYGQAWEMTPRMWFYSMWLSYARSWQAVLHSWDDATTTTTTTTDMMIRPQTPFPVGILMFNIEAQSIVARVEKKLVGMSQMHGHGD